MSLGKYGPVDLGFRPVLIVVHDSDDVQVPTLNAEGVQSPATIGVDDRVTFWLHPGDYTLTATKPEGAGTATYSITVGTGGFTPSNNVPIPTVDDGGKVVTVNEDGTGYELDALEVDVDHQVPAGGGTGQVLGKTSSDDYDVEWISNFSTAVSGAAGTVLVKTSNADGDVEWAQDVTLRTVAVTGTLISEDDLFHSGDEAGFFGHSVVTQPAPINDATDAGSAITQLNLVLTALRSLGLIDT